MKLEKQNVAVLGTLKGYSFSTLKKHLAAMGGKASKTVGKSTRAVIVGQNAGDKLLLAQMAGIPAFTDEQVGPLLEGASVAPLEPDAPELDQYENRDSLYDPSSLDFETAYHELKVRLGDEVEANHAGRLWLAVTRLLGAMNHADQEAAVKRLEALKWPEEYWFGNTWRYFVVPLYRQEVRYAPPWWFPGIFAGRDEPCYSLVRLLPLDTFPLWGEAAARVFTCPTLDNVRLLAFGSTLDKRFFTALSGATNLPRLRALHLHRSGCKGPSLKLLVSSEIMGQLETLQLSDTALGDVGVEAIVKGNTGALGDLRLRRAGLTSKSLEILARAPFVKSLRFLDLRDNEIGARALSSLLGELGPRLTVLRIGGCGLDDDAARAIAEATHLKNLRVIELQDNAITDEGARVLAAAPQVTGAEVLRIDSNDVQRQGAEALQKAMGERVSV